jgi:hypothetical protein
VRDGVGGHWAGGGGGADADGSAQPKTRTPHKDAGKKREYATKKTCKPTSCGYIVLTSHDQEHRL